MKKILLDWKNMQFRLLSSLVLIFLMLLILFSSSFIKFIFVSGMICVLSSWEWILLVKLTSNFYRILWLLFFIVLLMFISVLFIYFYSYYFLNILIYIMYISLIWWILVFFLILLYSYKVYFWQDSNILRLIFGMLTIIPFFVSLLILRYYHYNDDPIIGAFVLLYVMILIWGFDSGSYIFGCIFGTHKLAIRLSPNKTWEGLFGGILTSTIFGFIFYKNIYLDIFTSPFILLISSISAVLFSILGDLFESMMKRIVNVKDSGNIIPGHGGILDRIDSLMSAIPVFCWVNMINL